MNRRRIFIYALIAIIGVTGTLIWYRMRGPSKLVRPPNADQVLEMDRKNLTDGVGVNEHQIYAALMRLSQAGDPLAAREALKRATAPSEWVRAGSAEALGRSADKEARKLLAKLLQDSSELVRERAVRSLSYVDDEENRKILQGILEKSGVGDKELVQAHAALVKIGPVKERTSHVEKMVQIAQGQKGADQLASWLEIVSLAPHEEIVLGTLEKILRHSGESEDLEALAIRHLGASAPDRIRSRINELRLDKRPKVRLAAVQALSTACPLDRFEILKSVIDEEKESIVWRTAVQEAAMMPSDKTISLMKLVKARKMLEEDKQYVDDSLRVLEATKGPDPCELRSPRPSGTSASSK